jgi:hypothetical protein
MQTINRRSRCDTRRVWIVHVCTSATASICSRSSCWRLAGVEEKGWCGRLVVGVAAACVCGEDGDASSTSAEAGARRRVHRREAMRGWRGCSRRAAARPCTSRSSWATPDWIPCAHPTQSTSQDRLVLPLLLFAVVARQSAGGFDGRVGPSNLRSGVGSGALPYDGVRPSDAAPESVRQQHPRHGTSPCCRWIEEADWESWPRGYGLTMNVACSFFRTMLDVDEFFLAVERSTRRTANQPSPLAI